MITTDYPLLFNRTLLPKVWGADRLENYLSVDAPTGARIGESWELSDHEKFQSVVQNGPLKGLTLSALVGNYCKDLVGNVTLARGGRFPLLIKFVDASDRLSVQVHPSDEDARILNAPDGGKSEAWFFVHAGPGARVWVGLKPGRKFTDLENAREPREFLDNMRELRPVAGDAIAIATGTIHAIGADVTVAEVQQTSDVTYRIYDWGRPASPDRPLHLAESRVAARELLRPDLVHAGGAGQQGRIAPLPSPGFFAWNSRRTSETQTFSTDGRFRALICLGGEGTVETPSGSAAVRTGTVTLVPAGAGTFHVRPRVEMWYLFVDPVPAA